MTTETPARNIFQVRHRTAHFRRPLAGLAGDIPTLSLVDDRRLLPNAGEVLRIREKALINIDGRTHDTLLPLQKGQHLMRDSTNAIEHDLARTHRQA